MTFRREAMKKLIDILKNEIIPQLSKTSIDQTAAASGVGSRRLSLTLSTASGIPFTVTPSRSYHNVTNKIADNRYDELARVKAKRRSSGVTSLQENESVCPFHAMLAVRKRNQRITADAKAEDRHTSRASHTLTYHGEALRQNTLRELVDKVLDEKSPLRKTQRFLANLFGPKHDSASFNSTKSYSSIPGPKGLPILGSVLDYTFLGPFSAREFNVAMKARHERYGNIFKEKFLSEEFVYTSDPDDLNLIARNEGRMPIRPHLDVIVEGRKQEGIPAGITAVQGEEWGRLRSAVNSAIMKPKVVRSYVGAQKAVTDDFLKLMKVQRCLKTGEIPEYEVLLNKWALESVGVILLDTRLGLVRGEMNAETDPIADRLRTAMDVFFDYGARLTFGMPTWKVFQTKEWKTFRKSQRDEFDCAGHYVDKKLKEITNSPSTDSKTKEAHSFLEHLLKKTDLERNDATTLCLELLAGGIDTTSNAVTFTLYELSKNPEKQEKLRELLIKDSDNEIPETNSESSRYLRGCVHEALRLHPLTFINMRKTTKDLVLSGYQVPAGTVVRYTQHLMHTKNEEYYPEAENYIPERWVSRSSPHRCTKQFVFTPFGHGARQCPGRRIAEQELDLLLRAIFLNFRVEYHHEDIGTKVRLFNNADKPSRFAFHPLNC